MADRVFSHLDADKNGTIDKQEIFDFLQRVTNQTVHKISKMITDLAPEQRTEILRDLRSGLEVTIT